MTDKDLLDWLDEHGREARCTVNNYGGSEWTVKGMMAGTGRGSTLREAVASAIRDREYAYRHCR